MKNRNKGGSLLKITGVLMLVYGVFSIFADLILLLAFFMRLVSALKIPYVFFWLNAAFYAIMAVVGIYAGIKGIGYPLNGEKGAVLRKLGVIVFIAAAAESVLDFIYQYSESSSLAFACAATVMRVALPALFLLGIALKDREDDTGAGDTQEDIAREGDAQEGDAQEGDTQEGDAQEGDAQEGNAKGGNV